MKTFPRLAGAFAAFLVALTVSQFAARGQSSDSANTGKAHDPAWNVSVQLLMVEMPQEKALALMPDLRDPAKTDAAVVQILAAIDRKQATLIGYPIIQVVDGQRAVSETTVEKRYPTEFDPPTTPKNAGAKGAPPLLVDSADDVVVPTAFEVRNLGVSVEVETHVLGKGDWIRLDLVPNRVVLLGFDSYDAVRLANGGSAKIDQPRFYSEKTTTEITVRNGHHILLAIHKLPDSEDKIDLTIVQASATPIGAP